VEVLRTPEDRFSDLEGWPYQPRYVDVGDGLRMHYVDEGPSSESVVLLTHGEPTWGYLNRKLIPPLVDAGRRVVAPDLIGFGRSDKPAAREDYTYERHVRWTGALLEALDLRDVVLLGQDWGGLIFLVHVGRHPERFAGVVAANTALTDPAIGVEDVPPEAVTPFLTWLQWSQERPELLASEVVGGDSPLNQTGHRLTPAERAAYDAPFPDESFRAGARQFPLLVPLGDEDPPASMLREAWDGLERYEQPFVTAYGEHEDITSYFAGQFQQRIPGARDRSHPTIAGAGHFLQEHAPDLLVEVILELPAGRL
jgi:haloalkane dehalogenase